MEISLAMSIGAADAKNLKFTKKNQLFTTKNKKLHQNRKKFLTQILSKLFHCLSHSLSQKMRDEFF